MMLVEGGDTILAWALGFVSALLALILWIEVRRPARIVPDDMPNGDATETPQMLQHTRRVNHERRKA